MNAPFKVPTTDHLWHVAEDVVVLPQPIVNVVMVGMPEARDRGWVLIDTGLPGMANSIVNAAETRFGTGTRPAAIVLTHAHFDHVGSLEVLAARWDVPVYVPRFEMPYVTGRASYPPADPNVGGGAMAWLSPLYPRGPVNVEEQARLLDAHAMAELLPGWHVITTPGHSPGHVSFFRPTDRLLIAGDAFVTTDQESSLHALHKPVQVQGPPMYFTHDWDTARQSVAKLNALHPARAVTGHGRPVEGLELRTGLVELEQNFAELALPRHGRYVGQSARFDDDGPIFVPPRRRLPLPTLALGAALAGGVLLVSRWTTHR